MEGGPWVFQVEIHDTAEEVQLAFTPDEKTVAKARKVCTAFEHDKTGLVVGGELIELPHLREGRTSTWCTIRGARNDALGQFNYEQHANKPPPGKRRL